MTTHSKCPGVQNSMVATLSDDCFSGQFILQFVYVS